MKKIVAITLLILSPLVFSESSPYGIWRFPTTRVFIEISKDNSVFQCRIDKDLSVITAHGKFNGQKTIVWEPVKVVDANGKLNKIDFSWQKDEVTVTENVITLSGPYGAFTFEATSSQFPEKCK